MLPVLRHASVPNPKGYAIPAGIAQRLAEKSPMNSETAHAQAVAQAVYEAAHPLSLFLFGSRARGDHHTESDIDLLMVSDELCAAAAYG